MMETIIEWMLVATVGISILGITWHLFYAILEDIREWREKQ